MNCCSEVLENQNLSFKIAVVICALAAVAALVGCVALISIFVPPVGLFLVGASFTTALGTKICVGSLIVVSLFTAIATVLFCKQPTPVAPPDAPRMDEDRMIEHLRASLAHFHGQLNSLVIPKKGQAADVKPPVGVHFAKTVGYQFVFKETRVTIDYDPLAKKLTVAVDPHSEEYKSLIVKKLRELASGYSVE